jgi:DNA-binding LytR/AlgR family response regulator
MIKAIAIDDEPMPLKILTRYSQETDILELTKTFTSTQMAKKWLTENPVDLIFLDINMPAVSGLDFFKALEDNYMVVFTTAHSEYAVEGFNLNAVDYLLKPYSLERFMQAAKKVEEYHHNRKSKNVDSISIKSDLSMLKILLGDILFIEAYSDYLKIHRKNQKLVVTRMTMKEMEALLPESFLRVHRSFIVPLEQIEGYNSKEIIIGNQTICIGKTYLKKVGQIIK